MILPPYERSVTPAATQEITCGTFGHQAVVVGEALDVCSASRRSLDPLR